jgi:heme a synthase
MAQISTNIPTPIASWHRNLLTAAAIFTVLLIAMGGILCATQSIRNCPDWPGCFGRLVPPAETGAILEYTHRLLAAVSGLLILGSAIAGLTRKPRLRWIAFPPL